MSHPSLTNLAKITSPLMRHLQAQVEERWPGYILCVDRLIWTISDHLLHVTLKAMEKINYYETASPVPVRYHEVAHHIFDERIVEGHRTDYYVLVSKDVPVGMHLVMAAVRTEGVARLGLCAFEPLHQDDFMVMIEAECNCNKRVVLLPLGIVNRKSTKAEQLFGTLSVTAGVDLLGVSLISVL